MSITAKQRLFALEYMVDFNATQAAIRAGYSEKTAEQQASRLLRNVKVEKFISTLQKERESDCIMKVEDLQKMIHDRINVSVYDYANFTAGGVMFKDVAEIPKNIRPFIKEQYYDPNKGGWVIKLDDLTKYIDMLVKINGWYEKDNKQKGELSGEVVFKQTQIIVEKD